MVALGALGRLAGHRTPLLFKGVVHPSVAEGEWLIRRKRNILFRFRRNTIFCVLFFNDEKLPRKKRRKILRA